MSTTEKNKGKSRVIDGIRYAPGVRPAEDAPSRFDADEFSPKNTKVRITMMIDGDVLEEFKRLAAKSGKGYQTIMQENLRESVFGMDEAFKARVKRALDELGIMAGPERKASPKKRTA